jgi:hypothetical protein
VAAFLKMVLATQEPTKVILEQDTNQELPASMLSMSPSMAVEAALVAVSEVEWDSEVMGLALALEEVSAAVLEEVSEEVSAQV